MSHNSHQSRHGYHSNTHDSGSLTNGIAPLIDSATTKSRGMQFMDGRAQHESRTTHSNGGRHKSPIGQPRRPMSVYSAPVPKQTHHRTHSATDNMGEDDFRVQQHLYGNTSSVIGPSASIPERLGGANGSERSAFSPYKETTDGGMFSKQQYDISDVAEADHNKTPKHHNVQLLTYAPQFEPESESAMETLQERGGRREVDMTLSQEQYVTDLDVKIKAMMHTRKVSESRPRALKVSAPPTKENMKEVMYMTPDKKAKGKKSPRLESRKQERHSVHGVPWEMDKEREWEEGKTDREAQLQKKLEKKRQRQGKTVSSIELVGYRIKEDFSTPAIPEEPEAPIDVTQSKSMSFSSPSKPIPQNSSFSSVKTADTASTASSFEFRSSLSPTFSSVRQPSRSPARETADHMETDPKFDKSKSKVGRSETFSGVPSLYSSRPEQPEQNRVVYRSNLADTNLDDVAVFGKHFDPSQLTQERMVANVGDISMIGLNPTPVGPHKRQEAQRARAEVGGLSSSNLKHDHERMRPKSASVSPKRDSKKKEEESLQRKLRASSLKSRESEKLRSWEAEVQPPMKGSLASVISTPSRYRMLHISHSFRGPTGDDGNDVFCDEATKGSLPDLHQPYKGSFSTSLSPTREVPRGIKEGTPDSGTSEEEKPRKKRSIGYSIGRKLSSSMREIFAKEKKNPTSRTTWHFESGDVSFLQPAPSEPHLSALTAQERKDILEETEIVPKARSTEVLSTGLLPQPTSTTSRTPNEGNPLAHLFVPPTNLPSGRSNSDRLALSDDPNCTPPTGLFQERSVDGFTERSVDVPSSEQRKNGKGSDSEYDTASESEESYVKSAVNIITTPTTCNSALKEAGYFTSSTAPETTGEKAAVTPQTALPTIIERSPPRIENSGDSYTMPQSEGDPIVKSLDGVVSQSGKSQKDEVDSKNTKKPSAKSFGAVAKGKEKTTATVKKEDSTKEKKPLFSRFSKQRTVIQRRTPSPRPSSPFSDSPSGGSRQSSGRFSPSCRPTITTSTPPTGSDGSKTRKTDAPAAVKESSKTTAVRRTSKTSLGSPASSPRGSFRGVQASSIPSAGRGGSPRGSVRSGLNSPKGSVRGGVPSSITGAKRSPKSSIQGGVNSLTATGGGSPRGSVRGHLTSSPNLSGRGSPTAKTPSPRASMQLHVSPLSPTAPPGRKSPTVRTPTSSTGVSRLTSHTYSPDLSKRRLSEPASPLGSPLPIPKRSPSERAKNTGYFTVAKPRPVRPAPPPPISLSKSGASSSLSRSSSQTSAVTPTSVGNSPRQRKTGVSLPQSPLKCTPRKVSEVHVPPSIGEEARQNGEDEVGKLLTTVGEKLAPLSISPDDPNPLDLQTKFEIPPPFVEAQPPFSPPAVAKMPADVFTPSQDVVTTPEDSPGPVRRGLRPKTVVSSVRDSGSKNASGRDSPTTTKSKGLKTGLTSGAQTGRGSFRKSKLSAPGLSTNAVVTSGRSSPSVTKKISAPSLNGVAVKTAQSGIPVGLPPRAPGLRKIRSDVSTGRSMSTVEVPSIRVSETRGSMRKASMASAGSLSTGPRSSKLGAGGNQPNIVRSSIRVSGKLKKNCPMSPEHRKMSSLTRPKQDSPSHSNTNSLLRAGTTAARSSVRKPVRVAPVAPGRTSMRRVSSTGETLNRNKMNTNSLEKRRQSVLNKSLRKTSTAHRPQTQTTSGGTLNRNTANRSMRRGSISSSRKVSSVGSLPRISVVNRLGTQTSAGSIQSTSVARKSMRKTSSVKDVYEAFDQISAEAQGKLLTSSDHRRAVRPKLRQKASSSHLRMLQDRKDITSEMVSPSSSEKQSGLDPNTYSTYMSKRNLAPSALAGLATKLDLSMVKLRKTGIADKMVMEQLGGVIRDLPNMPNMAMGAEYDTKHTTLLLQIKGRRQVHTRLVEPSVTSMNSGDVYICISGKSLYHWVGKSANVIEKARSSDVVMRIMHKKELGCQAMAPVVMKEEVREPEGSVRIEKFWELLGGRKGIKSSESVPNDDLFEKSVNMVSTVMQLEGTDDSAHYTTIHENSNHMLKTSLLDTKKILLLDFHSEVYVWVGKMSPPKLRRKALELGKKHFDAGCKPPVFTHQGAGGSTVVRSSGRYRAKVSSTHSPRNNTLSRSGRRVSRVKKEQGRTARPSWALFNRINEGSEHILFREKFSDWPEQGRIIKMKGHSTAPVMPTGPAELQPADVEKMLRPTPKFEGLRLEGDNVHRGQGNYKVSKSTFACNRVHPNKATKWVIKDNDNVEVPESDHGLFYMQEAYVIRWSYRITVVKELEGLVPGNGMFARERKHQKENGVKSREVSDAQTGKIARGNDSSDTESEDEGVRDEESRKILESGGRDKVAYFFWQGDHCTVNEKGASALLTVELDKERGPQVRVVQGKEPPAFLNLFAGGMVLMKGRSETHSLKSPSRPIRLFVVRGQTRSEACLMEIEPEHWPIAKFFRSRGCYIVYDAQNGKIYLWKGCRITETLRKGSHTAARLLKHRLKAELVMISEGQEPKDFCALIGDKTAYESLLKDARVTDYTPRLFELSSTTGEFVASEVLYTARGIETEAAPVLQSDLYAATQPAIFLLDAHKVVYVWLGWWPQERRDWSIMRETNITTGSAHARWLRDKKLALQTAQLYSKASTETRTRPPKTYLIHAGTEPEQFTNLFPFWKPDSKVQDLQCKGRKPIPQRFDVDEELMKYSRTQFSLKELQNTPLPEGVDPSKLEIYLSDKDFEAVFKINREKFQQFPSWKQTDIKKRIGLF